MNWECTFYTYTVRNFSYCKCFTDSTALAFDDNTFEYLNTFTTSFNYFYVNFNSITSAEIRMICTKLIFSYFFDYILHPASLLPNLCSYPSKGSGTSFIRLKYSLKHMVKYIISIL